MKKHAFTLAETLLTLAIIGICAAMTVPSIKNLTNSTREQEADVMSKKIITNFSGASSQILMTQSKTRRMNDIGCNDATDLFNLYGKFLQISAVMDKSDIPNGFNGDVVGRLADSSIFGLEYDKACNISKTGLTVLPGKSGSNATSPVVINATKACGIIYFDTNGVKGPNTDGIDRFAVPIFKSGVKIPSVTASASPST